VSNETALKMSNATAMRSAGIKMGKYSWLSGGAPSVSSPLAGKRKGKRKAGEDDDGEADADAGEGVKNEDDMLGAGKGKGKAKGKSKLAQSTTAEGARRKRPRVTAPTRRLVAVDPDPHGGPPLPFIQGQVQSGGGAERERRIPDDRALCATDVVFAIKRDRAVGEDVVRRAVVSAGTGRRRA
jgi:hypothetical protein